MTGTVIVIRPSNDVDRVVRPREIPSDDANTDRFGPEGFSYDPDQDMSKYDSI